jgi:hypothetical protein
MIEFNKGISNIFIHRDMWVNKWELQSMKFFKMLKRLIDVYPYFVGLFIAVQKLLGNPVINGLLNGKGENPLAGIKLPQFGKKQGEGNEEEDLEEEEEKIVAPIPIVKFYQQPAREPLNLFWIFLNMPGSDCFETGYSFASIIRFVASISIDDPCSVPVLEWRGVLLDFCSQR